MKDAYTSLGVSKTATQEEIKNAYRKLAKKFHPDLNPGNKQAEAKFKEFSAANEILSDPVSRAKYDRGEWEQPAAGAHARPEAGGHYEYDFGAGGDFDDIFAQFFRSQRQHADEVYQMEIDFREAIQGAEKEIALPSGKRLHVKIPGGVAEGMRLRFAGQGQIRNGRTSDVYVEIRFREDPRFLRDGRDLVHELSVSVVDAILGGEVRVPTPEGEVLLKIPPRTDTGRKIRLPGKGVALKGQKERGDLTVVVKLVLPENMDATLERAIREWKERNPRSAA